MNAILCRHIRPSHTRCRAVAPLGHLYCVFHLRQRERAAIRKAQPQVIPPFDPFLHLGPFPTFQEVQAAFGKVLNALAADRIDDRRASFLLRQLDGAHRLPQAPSPRATAAAPRTPDAQRNTLAS